MWLMFFKTKFLLIFLIFFKKMRILQQNISLEYCIFKFWQHFTKKGKCRSLLTEKLEIVILILTKT